MSRDGDRVVARGRTGIGFVALHGTFTGDVLALYDGKERKVFDGRLGGGELTGTWTDVDDRSKAVSKPMLLHFLPSKADLASWKGDAELGGVLGNATRIHALLHLDHGKLAGVYRYARSNADLKLDGTIDTTSGAFDLRETTAAGVVTGRLRGVAFGRDDLVGTWVSPDGTKSYPFWLSSSHHGLGGYPETLEVSGVKLTAREESADYGQNSEGFNCAWSRTLPRVEGDKALELAVNPALEEAVPKQTISLAECKAWWKISIGPCCGYDNGYAVTYVGKSALGIQTFHDSFAGGAHGMYGWSCFLVDLVKKRLVSIASAMSAAQRESLGKLAADHLRKDLGTADLTTESFFDNAATVSANTAVCVQNDGIHVSFNPYEIGAWVLQGPDVPLTYAEAKPLLPADIASLLP